MKPLSTAAGGDRISDPMHKAFYALAGICVLFALLLYFQSSQPNAQDKRQMSVIPPSPLVAPPVSSPSPQATCPGVQVLGGGVLKLDVPSNCRNAFEVALVNSNVEKTFQVQFTSEVLTEPPFTTGRATTMNYDRATGILKVDGDLYYKHKPEDIGKQALLIMRPVTPSGPQL
jgi:hypothetical protein